LETVVRRETVDHQALLNKGSVVPKENGVIGVKPVNKGLQERKEKREHLV